LNRNRGIFMSPFHHPPSDVVRNLIGITKRRMHLTIRHNALCKDQYRRLWYCSLASASDMSHCQVDRPLLLSNRILQPNVSEMEKVIGHFI
jgi:hypothetical protein